MTVIDRARLRHTGMTRLLSAVAAGLVVAALAVPTIAADAAASTPRQQLERNQARWDARHLRDYRFRLRVACSCPAGNRPVTITVRNGRPRGAPRFVRALDTIPKLFSEIRRALDDPKAGNVTARYDTRRGYPRSASIDRIKNAVDDEFGWTLDRFRVL
jgi:hypothetical protein